MILSTRRLLITAAFLAITGCTGSADDRIDLIIEGDYVVTMDAEGTVIPGGAVAVDDGVILAVGTADNIRGNFSAVDTLDGVNRIVMPGLVNGHSHAAMTLLRGVADDLALMDWLNNYIFPAEVEFVDAELRSLPAGR
jgi:5-methylthioadenosine/S-adenosylhomocysteine deaminase